MNAVNALAVRVQLSQKRTGFIDGANLFLNYTESQESSSPPPRPRHVRAAEVQRDLVRVDGAAQ